jgi:hypothetical protein
MEIILFTITNIVCVKCFDFVEGCNGWKFQELGPIPLGDI